MTKDGGVNVVVSLSIAKLLSHTGGVLGLLELLEKHDQPSPLAPAVAQWKTRNNLPRRWVGPVLYVLTQQGVHPLDILDGLPTGARRLPLPQDIDDPFGDADAAASDEVLL